MAPSIFMLLLFAVLICVVTGMRSWVDNFNVVSRLVPARQHCAPVSAITLMVTLGLRC